MERNVSVRTPEAIAFYYELAGIGSRFLAVAVDFIIQLAVTIGLLIAIGWASDSITAFGRSLGASVSLMDSLMAALMVLVVFLWQTGYFIAFEMWWNGQTPGKRAIGIRVVRDGGYPVTFMASVIRNLIRLPEELLGYVPSVISALASAENKRLGDLAAGTIVVRDRAFEVPDPASWSRPESDRAPASPIAAGIGQISEDEFALVERYLARVGALEPAAARDTAARIAATMRSKFGPEGDRYTDHELLLAIADARRR